MRRYPGPLPHIEIPTFQYGLNSRDVESALVPGETRNCKNVEIAGGGSRIQQRPGSKKFDDGLTFPSGGSVTVDNLYAWETAAETWTIIASSNGKIISISETGVTTLLFTGTAGTIWRFVAADNAASASRVWCMNGVDAPQRITPGSPPTIAAWAGAPPNGGALNYWRGRMVVGNYSGEGDRLAFSNAGDPETWVLGTEFTDLKSSNDDSDFVVDLYVLGEELFVLKRRSCWKVLNPVTFEALRTHDYGQVSTPTAVGRSCQLGDDIYFCSDRGIYRTNGVNATCVTSRITLPHTNSLGCKQVTDATGLSGGTIPWPGNLFLCPVGQDRLLAISPTTTEQVNQGMILEYYPSITFQDPHTGHMESPWMIHQFEVGSGFQPSCGCFYSDSTVFDGLRILIGGRFTTGSFARVLRWGQGDDNCQDADRLGPSVPTFAKWRSGKLPADGSLEQVSRLRRLNFIGGSPYRRNFSDTFQPLFAVSVDAYPIFGEASGTPGQNFTQAISINPANFPDIATSDNKEVFIRVRPELRGRVFAVTFMNTDGGVATDFAVQAPIELVYREATT